jgi:hypothetical protein
VVAGAWCAFADTHAVWPPPRCGSVVALILGIGGRCTHGSDKSESGKRCTCGVVAMPASA